MLDPELVALLVCPETHQDVSLASAAEIAELNAAIGRGAISTVKGMPVEVPVEGALIRQDRSVAYPIRDGIPVMLVAEGLTIAQMKLNGHG